MYHIFHHFEVQTVMQSQILIFSLENEEKNDKSTINNNKSTKERHIKTPNDTDLN